MMILSGDVGGTNTRLALVEVDGSMPRIAVNRDRPSADYDSLNEVVASFVEEIDADFEAVCFGIPGPVHSGKIRVTNLPWVVDRDQLVRSLGVPVILVNDLEAAAWSLPVLGEDDLVSVRDGEDAAEGNRALISPGTGLGVAGLYWDGSEHRPFASEGGHADFGPSDAFERDLLADLGEDFDHVSWERVVSGPGLVAIHEFLQARRGERHPSCPAQCDDGDRAPSEITRAARQGLCPVCVEAVERFCRLLGAHAGNAALMFLATGGLWIGGGIAPNIVDQILQGEFERGFLAKGRLREVMERIPVWIITDDHAAVRGAARRAAHEVRRS